LRQAHQGRPPASRDDIDVLLPIERLVGKQRLVHPVDQMYAGIRQTFALFGDIEIPSGARIRQARNDFPQIMHAAQENSRLLFGARD
jgi:hypothetical protein